MSAINFEKQKQPELVKHDSSVLDLAFAMDATGSMGSYIENARKVGLLLLFKFYFICLKLSNLFPIKEHTTNCGRNCGLGKIRHQSSSHRVSRS